MNRTQQLTMLTDEQREVEDEQREILYLLQETVLSPRTQRRLYDRLDALDDQLAGVEHEIAALRGDLERGPRYHEHDAELAADLQEAEDADV